jgi:hypothetical protein
LPKLGGSQDFELRTLLPVVARFRLDMARAGGLRTRKMIIDVRG